MMQEKMLFAVLCCLFAAACNPTVRKVDMADYPPMGSGPVMGAEGAILTPSETGEPTEGRIIGDGATDFSVERMEAAIDRVAGPSLGQTGPNGEDMAAPVPTAQSIAPEPVRAVPVTPAAPKAAAVDLVQYAKKTTHDVGTKRYARSSLQLQNPQAACGGYAGAEAAQQAFLAAGGPDKDVKGLDPDGDGYACGWNPAPLRAK